MLKLGKKTFALLVVCLAAFLLATGPVGAQSYYGLQKSAAVQANTALVLPAETWVYGIEIFADAANSFMGVYDVATLTGCVDAAVKDEIGEATQYDTATKMYTKPVFYENGVTVVIATGVGFVYYGPQPSGDF